MERISEKRGNLARHLICRNSVYRAGVVSMQERRKRVLDLVFGNEAPRERSKMAQESEPETRIHESRAKGYFLSFLNYLFCLS